MQLNDFWQVSESLFEDYKSTFHIFADRLNPLCEEDRLPIPRIIGRWHKENFFGIAIVRDEVATLASNDSTVFSLQLELA